MLREHIENAARQREEIMFAQQLFSSNSNNRQSLLIRIFLKYPLYLGDRCLMILKVNKDHGAVREVIQGSAGPGEQRQSPTEKRICKLLGPEAAKIIVFKNKVISRSIDRFGFIGYWGKPPTANDQSIPKTFLQRSYEFQSFAMTG